MSTATAFLPASRLEQEAMTETYRDVEKLIYKMCHPFVQRYHLNWDDVLSVAHHTFVACYRKYKKKPGAERQAKFSTYICFAVTCDLTTFCKKEFRRTSPLIELDPAIAGTEDSNHFFLNLQDRLSGDALMVAQLVVDAPADLSELLRWREAHCPKQVRHVLQEHLETIGWTQDRVAIAFDELCWLFRA